MKLNSDSLMYFSLIFIVPFLLELAQNLTTQDSKRNSRKDKEIRNLFSKMKYMEGDTFTMGITTSSQIRMTTSDSTLFAGGIPRRTAIEPYYISATEVTNADWREFYQAKVLELGESIGKSNFFPDTASWVKEFPYRYNGPMSRHYFSHPKFNDYPVVGITWDQAKAYCTWKSKKLKILLAKSGINSAPEFRLPTEAEWEYAAMKKAKDKKKRGESPYGWLEKDQIRLISELANIGQIRDINNIMLKQYGEDGCLYTCKVASYPPNENKLYDMAGNVSEWTNDQGSIMAYRKKEDTIKILTKSSEIESEIEHVKNNADIEDPEFKRLIIESLAHNMKVFSSNDIKICKGGSWAKGMIYTQPGSRQGIDKDKASSTIGFRLVMSDVNQEVKKYFPKKNWKP